MISLYQLFILRRSNKCTCYLNQRYTYILPISIDVVPKNVHTWSWDPNNLLKLLVAYQRGQSNFSPSSGSNIIATKLVISTNFVCPCLQLRVWEGGGECGHKLWSVEGGPALSWCICEQTVFCIVYDPCECKIYFANEHITVQSIHCKHMKLIRL